MKVMCIKDDWNPKDGSEPIFGEIVTASQSTIYSGATGSLITIAKRLVVFDYFHKKPEDGEK